MDIRPTPSSEVYFYDSIPFSIDYKNIILFNSLEEQQNYFNSVEKKAFLNSSYVKESVGTIKVNANKEELLKYNYMSFKNSLYGNKVFYAFITGVAYSNPNVSYVSFSIDVWQTWCFDITFRESFIERKHCKRWNSDGTPVINTQPENLELGTQYLVKDHQQYNNNMTWVCFVTSLDFDTLEYTDVQDVPNPLLVFYAPIYKSTNRTLNKWTLNGQTCTPAPFMLNYAFRNERLRGKLVNCFMLENPSFDYEFSLDGDTINITSSRLQTRVIDTQFHLGYDTKGISVSNETGLKVPNRTTRNFTKYGNLIDKIRRSSIDKGESKLLMYPYSFVTLLDGQGNTFDIELEYLKDTQIKITTYTSGGNSSKLAHIVENYRHDPNDVTLGACRWELQNGIISANSNDLTIIDDYTAAYLQGNRNQIEQGIIDTQNQSSLNNQMATNMANANLKASAIEGLGGVLGSAANGALIYGPAGALLGMPSVLTGAANVAATNMIGQANTQNTRLQGNLTNERATADALAKYNDIQNMPDNVSLMGGNVFFTFQNQFAGYCLVYKQISDEYIDILSNYFKKYGYAYNKIEVPNLHTRNSWDYIRTIDVNIVGKVNDTSLEAIKNIFNQGVTIWHTTDVGNYSLNNNEI